MIVTLPELNDTEQLGAKLAAHLHGGVAIHLAGELGAGKTTLVRALLRALGVSGRIKSPSYTLVEPYQVADLYLYHFDCYRFGNPREWLDAGFAEYFRSDSVCLIEWPEKAGATLPAADILIQLVYTADGVSRRATLSAPSVAGKRILAAALT